MKIPLSAACLMLALVAMTSEAATTRAVRINQGTFRAVSRQQGSSPAVVSPGAVFSSPGNSSAGQSSSFSSPARSFAPSGAAFSGSHKLSESNNRFRTFKASWPLRKVTAPEPAPEESSQPAAGAFIRTAGSGYRVEPGGPFGVHAVEAGNGFIQDKAGGQPLEGPGLRQGASDSGTSGASQGSGAGSSPLGASLNPEK